MKNKNPLRNINLKLSLLLFLCIPTFSQAAVNCSNKLVADVVALDQLFFYNRLGVVLPHGMIYALKEDVQFSTGGGARLRDGKRPRPLALRFNAGSCLQVNFENHLAPAPIGDQPSTRYASVHVQGMQLVGSIASDGSNVGQNASSLVPPGGTATYTFYAQKEGTYLMYSSAATTGGEGNGGTIAHGLFGAVNVEPAGAEFYRSQLTENEMALATTGNTPAGHPIINFDAVYPAGHPRAGLPIIKMVQGNKLVHGDLNAVITGAGRGRFSGYAPNPANPDRNQPFREFTIIYHDDIKAIQAFPDLFNDPVLHHTLHSVRDGFAFNYGTGGVGAEILANRLGVGPMHKCTACKYEEFFLTSWAVGDPAMVVDIPANAVDGAGNLIVGPKATKAFYPEDPSNVFHSYLKDHVKMRLLHAGPKEHHVHHLHAHQWLHTPDSDNSSYLDSQALGPGSGFTLEIAYNGSGNRNQTVGDSIFHCHFYPHFAQGMWAMWRVHDVFETGTKLDADGRAIPGTRALPDAEITTGTPIPAVVPIPTIAMAPMPQAQASIDPATGEVQVTGAGNPGYPFFIPGRAGHRPPRPPLDTLVDGGLTRHVMTEGEAISSETRLDFSKEVISSSAIELPEAGTAGEIAAMEFHEKRLHASYTPEGQPANFMTNGLPRKAGAPFADPCMDDSGNPTGTMRTYKAANIQLDITFNKAGWHFPQSRIITLAEDVQDTLNGTRPPEPLFFRANSQDCVEYQHTNLVPKDYELDDFQVRTPTDILGQHIHLVKFDVTSSDGSGNGWNYEDGTLSPGEVVERIHAIRKHNACVGKDSGDPRDGTFECPVAEAHPFYGPGPNNEWMGAMTTVQRWYADELLNNLGTDRTLRTVFTHDHYGPSTHQQAGLYAGLVVEPKGSTWRDPETGTILGTRDDGGPTSWRADILTANANDSYREFLLEFADMQLAYKAGNQGFPDPANAINPPGRNEIGLPFFEQRPQVCPGGVAPPCPEAISADDPGTMTVNYRSEPLALRIRDPATNSQATGLAGDLSYAFASNVTRADDRLNIQPNFYPPLTADVRPGDPYTPLLRAYEADKVQIRMLVGAQEEGHNFNIHGQKWLYEPSDPNSGYRSGQMSGISEHFEFRIPALGAVAGSAEQADYLYAPGYATDDLWNGTWGLMRVYNGGLGLRDDLIPLPNNPDGKSPKNNNPRDFAGVCPRKAPTKKFSVTATTAAQALPGGTLVYNSRQGFAGRLTDPTALIYVNTKDLNKDGTLKAGVPIEPLILRANAGDCIQVTLINDLPVVVADLDGWSKLPMIVDFFNNNQITPSSHVGLHAQLLAYDVGASDGANVGFNPVQTAPPLGGQAKYKWYAGDVTQDENGNKVAVPIEFGPINLTPSDPIKHASKGAIGALIIEPQGATWEVDADSRAQATITKADGSSFREFVMVFQTDVNLRFDDGNPVPLLAEAEDPEDSGQKAINYRTEPLWHRMGYSPETLLVVTNTMDFSNSLSNSQVGGDPETPVFTAKAGTAVRMRLVQPGGHARNGVFQVHGHSWQQLPYVNDSTEIGNRPESEVKGAQHGIGPANHFDFNLSNGAGGAGQVPGDYLYRDQSSFHFDGGLWGIVRVQP